MLLSVLAFLHFLQDLHSQLTGAPRVDKLQATFQMLASARASQRLDLQALAQLNAGEAMQCQCRQDNSRKWHQLLG
jgi:hypothetical protein